MFKFVLRALGVVLSLSALFLAAYHFHPARSVAAAQAPPASIQLVPVVSGLSSPIFITSARDGSNRLFIVEQTGRIRVLPPGANTPLATPFLDVTGKIVCCGEQGLLGLAFHPQYASNRRFFINYTRRGDGATVISEFTASASDPNVAETAEKIILTIAQPFSNHNGGMIDFGPDGFMYIGTGDGGSGNDPGNRAQNIEELLGKMLRIDVDTPNGAVPYSSPSSNPFFGATPGRDEIYATGLRNPWRHSFDRATGQLYAGDVGQGQIEEVSLITLGGNYGWRVYEGMRCTNLGPAACTPSNYVAPITEYNHSGGRCSVTGGYAYRGARSSLPAGGYIYGDFCSGEIFLFQNNAARLLLDTSLQISSFGEDEAGELYVVGLQGNILRIAAPGLAASVSAASYRGSSLAPEAIVAAFGTALATATQAAPSNQTLPTTLAGLTVRVTDAAGTTRNAPLFFVSPTQVNYQLPPGTASGAAAISFVSANGTVANETISIGNVAPSLFSANATGRGLAAAVVQRVRGGTQTTEPVTRFDGGSNQLVAVPIDLEPETDEVFLVLFGTGFRFRSALSGVTATVGGTPVEVTFAGAQNTFTGLDQANLRLPRSLIGRGEVEVVLMLDGQTANTVRVSIK
jgi:uncharacterized protein (TIGR03437 family)